MYPTGSSERCPLDGSPLYVLGSEGAVARPWSVGDVIAEKYKLIEARDQRVGAGLTFLADQLRFNRVVELRILSSNEGPMMPSDHARFQREVSTWAKVRSPYIMRLYDFGFTEREEPYITLEFTNRGTLRDLLKQRGYLSFEEGLMLSEHILKALHTAHTAQVLHRNVNPDAIVLHTLADGASHYRLTGFAVAKHMGDEADDPTAITMTGQVTCDPVYMAPESIMMGILEPRTDLYALGVTLYEAFSGQRPFPGDQLSEILAVHVHGAYTPIESHRPEIPVALKAFIGRLLHHDPQQRFPSASAALESLRELQANFEQLREVAAHAQQARIPLTIKRGLWASLVHRVSRVLSRKR